MATARCKECGADIPRSPGSTQVRHYCSPDCRPRCSVDICTDPQHGNGYCANHNYRFRKYGNAEEPLKRTSNQGLLCEFQDCTYRRRKRMWCQVHYNQWRLGQELQPITRKWATDLVCVVCQSPSGQIPGFRKFCGPNCSMLWRKHKGNVPGAVQCAACAVQIPLVGTGKNGWRKRSDVRLCRRCSQDRRKHGMSVEQLAVRDGTGCGICGSHVDMSLQWPDLMRASVDHVRPRAHGGTNDPGNLQLAHLLCNSRKRDTYEVTT